jgi:hypothetical protein
MRGSGHGAWGMGHGAWGIGHWALGMGHWALGTGYWDLQAYQSTSFSLPLLPLLPCSSAPLLPRSF